VQLQDLAIAANAALILTAFGLALTGPNHLKAHIIFVVAALLVPASSFDLTRAAELPAQAWIFCAFYALGHLANTLFHVRRPDANHSLGPEVFVQTVGIALGVAARSAVPADLWYRGTVGAVVFCLTSLFVMMIVLMVYYQSELVAHATDDVDVLKDSLRSKSNAALLCCGPTALLACLYIALGHPALLVASAVAFFAIKALVPPLPRTWTPAG
jgi:hypothetical protein